LSRRGRSGVSATLTLTRKSRDGGGTKRVFKRRLQAVGERPFSLSKSRRDEWPYSGHPVMLLSQLDGKPGPHPESILNTFAFPGPDHSRLLLNLATLKVNRIVPSTPIASICGHRISTPMPLRKMPRTTTR
jgi:hypothetical protein